ncbi:MAG: NAD(P)H-hydrate dehydratase [bacterium]
MEINTELIKQIVSPKSDSHKGENGRVLVIGGSELFHAAPFWAAAAASKIVDMVHFTSPYLLNNELMEKRAKEHFWSGIVVPWGEVEHYINEDDAILIGPGMERGEVTKKIVDELLIKYSNKRWVIDGGALQEVDPRLLGKNMIVTPNPKELVILKEKTKGELPSGITILAKGVVDVITDNHKSYAIEGGNPGMTKGGTGDVLAGIVVGLFAKSSAVASCYVASITNKRIGERLAKKNGNFFDAGDMICLVGEELSRLVNLL